MMITAFWMLVFLLAWLVISLVLRVAFKVFIPQHIQEKIERLHEHD